MTTKCSFLVKEEGGGRREEACGNKNRFMYDTDMESEIPFWRCDSADFDGFLYFPYDFYMIVESLRPKI